MKKATIYTLKAELKDLNERHEALKDSLRSSIKRNTDLREHITELERKLGYERREIDQYAKFLTILHAIAIKILRRNN